MLHSQPYCKYSLRKGDNQEKQFSVKQRIIECLCKIRDIRHSHEMKTISRDSITKYNDLAFANMLSLSIAPEERSLLGFPIISHILRLYNKNSGHCYVCHKIK